MERNQVRIVYRGEHARVLCAGREWARNKPQDVDPETAEIALTNSAFRVVKSQPAKPCPVKKRATAK
ncbi:MAG: hypothetical protein ACK47B_23795 [Armatimonadota bacterium]